MGRTAQTDAQKHLKALQEKRERENAAADAYKDALKRYLQKTGPKPSFRSFATRYSINYQLLQRRVNNVGKSKADSNAAKGRLTMIETHVLIDFSIEMAHRGFPLTPKSLTRYAEEIVHTRDPTAKFGKNWATRFLVRHGNQISTKWSVSLDTVRARSVNINTVNHWYNLLGAQLKLHNFRRELIFGMDETGCPLGGGQKTRVIAPTDEKIQHAQRDGSKENVTVICCICADGSNVPPVIIFKGKNMLAKWKQDNPIDAAYCRSDKGWTDSQIAVDWLEKFHEDTKGKVQPGEKRLLLVDGHISHVSKAFIDLSIKHGIVVLCYPPHATHVLQGLDVVCFSPLKKAWSELRDTYEEETGEAVVKETFLKVYGPAHIRAFTAENNRKAFEKTGVFPFNPSVIPASALAPSLEHSSQATLPVSVPEAVLALVSMWRQTVDDIRAEQALLERDDGAMSDGEWEGEGGGITDDDADDLEEAGGVPKEAGSGQWEDVDEVAEALQQTSLSETQEDTRVSSLRQLTPPPRTRLSRQSQVSVSVSGSMVAAVGSSRPSPIRNRTLPHTPHPLRLRRALASTSARALVGTEPLDASQPIPKPSYLGVPAIDWTLEPSSTLAEENNRLQAKLEEAHDLVAHQSAKLEEANATMTLSYMFAERYRKQAISARKPKTGKRVAMSGYGRIISDAQLAEVIERNAQEEEARVRAKAARKLARTRQQRKGEKIKAQREAKKIAWEQAKAAYAEEVESWGAEKLRCAQEGLRIPKKPLAPKQKEVWRDAGLDGEVSDVPSEPPSAVESETDEEEEEEDA